jgi:hypothetical protein
MTKYKNSIKELITTDNANNNDLSTIKETNLENDQEIKIDEQTKTRRETISKKHDKNSLYEPIEEVVKDDSYYLSRRSNDKSNRASDMKIKQEEQGLGSGPWVEDLEEQEIPKEVNPHEEMSPSRNSSANTMKSEDNGDFKGNNIEEEKVGNTDIQKEASVKNALDQLEEKDQNYIEFNITQEELNKSKQSVPKQIETVGDIKNTIHKVSQNNLSIKNDSNNKLVTNEFSNSSSIDKNKLRVKVNFEENINEQDKVYKF